jgi:predicted RNase H-like nuclease
VTRLARSVPELPTPENCRQAQERLQKSHPEVAFECLAEGQGMGVHVTRKPEGMREEQALTLAWDAFRESVFGPWATAWPAP